MTENENKLKKLHKLFGSYRAEWLKEKIFDLFTEPSYFLGLQNDTPCVLLGGRGTGKTTVLRGLSYQGQYSLLSEDITRYDQNNYIGIYHRVNTNHVRAFAGGGINDGVWNNIFAHYFSLLVCREILLFVDWHRKLSNSDELLSSKACSKIAKAVHISRKCEGFEALLDAYEDEMYEFQAQINNLSPLNIPNLSLPGDPLRLVTEQVLNLSQFKGKMFYFLIDEYENYTNSQQQIINTFIKHSTDSYTFKIGVRELGWRVKHTLNKEETLSSPSDYELIDINQKVSESYFIEFAERVCQPRIKELIEEDGENFSLAESIQTLTMEDEAVLLGVNNHEYLKEYLGLSKKYKKITASLTPLYKFFIVYWSKKESQDLTNSLDNYSSNEVQWNTRYDNYKYEMLFKIRKGRGMVGIQKYYTGWQTYTILANGNIRYLMELVYKSYEKHLLDGKDLREPISFENQTNATKEVGKKNLMELEGLWRNGAQLTKVLLGFGRVFNVLSSEGVDVAPEINQFKIIDEKTSECKELLDAAVMNLALVRMPGNKLSGSTSTRDYLYSLHPIYSPYFVFSHRKKRKMDITTEQFMGIIDDPGKTIKDILSKRKVIYENIELPSQLSLFEDHFRNDK